MKNKKINLKPPKSLSMKELVDFYVSELLNNKDVIDLVKNNKKKEFEEFIHKKYVIAVKVPGEELSEIDELMGETIDELIIELIFDKIKSYQV